MGDSSKLASSSASPAASTSASHNATPPLAALPPELIDQILSFLSPYDVVNVSAVSRKLNEHSNDDRLWQDLVQRNVASPLTSHGPCKSFKDLFIQHHPRWSLTRYKLWFSDFMHNGKLILARFDQRRGCIEAYALAAERGPYAQGTLDWDGSVGFRTFHPKVQLDLEKPVLRLSVNTDHARSTKFVSEIPMVFDEDTSSIASIFTHSRALPKATASWTPTGWPPSTLPSPGDQRTRNESRSAFQSLGHKPTNLSEASDATFRIRQWIEFHRFLPRQGAISRTAEVVHTYGTLPEECYTPTQEKPWQGIWCGDYSGHGCEFLVIMQPDSSEPLPEKADRAFAIWPHTLADVYGENSDEEEDDDDDDEDDECDRDEGHDHFGTAHMNAAATRRALRKKKNTHEPSPNDVAPYKGRLVAVKLTGDPNVPKGEITFIVEDLGARGLVGFAPEPLFNEDSAYAQSSKSPYNRGKSNVGYSRAQHRPAIHSNFGDTIPNSDDIAFPMPLTSPGSVPSIHQNDSRGARIVRAVGQVANNGFVNDDYIPSQVILMNENTLAQYWRPYGCVSFFRRVNLDEFLKRQILPET